jgi:hypothetical protein
MADNQANTLIRCVTFDGIEEVLPAGAGPGCGNAHLRLSVFGSQCVGCCHSDTLENEMSGTAEKAVGI